MVKLQWLQVNKFRSVKPGTRLTFNAGHNVLLGQNGTGKTTLLNLIAAAVRLDFTDFNDEELELSYELVSDKASARISVRSESQSLPIPSELKDISTLYSGALASASRRSTPKLSFTVVIFSSSTGTQVKFDVDGEGGTVQSIDGSAPSMPLGVVRPQIWVTVALGLAQWCRGVPELQGMLPDLLGAFLGGMASRFDESLEYFDGLGERQLHVQQEKNGQITSFGDLDPSDIIGELIVARAKQEWGADQYVLTDADLLFLKRTIQLIDFESAEAIFELQDSTNSEQDRVMRLGNLRFYFRHRGGQA